MNKICGIYKITSPSGKIYIGQSVNVLSRKSRYVNLHCEKQIILYRSLKKYGWDEHDFKIIRECSRDELNKLERYYIKQYNTFNSEHGMNLTNGGDAASREISKETKKKMSDSLMGNKRTLGYKYSDERREEISERIRISKMGYKHTKETKQKISESHIGIKPSKETIKKIRETKKNRTYKSRAGNYEIYNQNNELIYKFCGDFRRTLENLNVSVKGFTTSHKLKRKIKCGTYKGWYAVKLE